LPPLDKRTMAALATLAGVSVLILVALLNQPVTQVGTAPVVILATRTAMPPSTPTVVSEPPTPIPSPPAPPPVVEHPVIEQPAVVVQPIQEQPQAKEPVVDLAATSQEATAQSWVNQPVSTPTRLPEPGEDGFKESFKDPPECSPLIGYLGEKLQQCATFFAEQTQTP
jgi:hypothetical protein